MLSLLYQSLKQDIYLSTKFSQIAFKWLLNIPQYASILAKPLFEM